MLDQRDGRVLIDYVWKKLDCRIQLPDEDSGFFSKKKRSAAKYDDRRRYSRHFVNSKMAVVDGAEVYCAYSLNLSRSGIAFLHSQQVYPKQSLCLCFPDGTFIEATIVFCRRVNDNCYECGAEFAERDAECEFYDAVEIA